MINKIIDGICEALFTEFGNTYKIYTESVEQGLTEPCFSITCINPTNELFRNKRYFRKNQFCIHYFPSTQEKKNECNSVLERLYNCLEYIIIKETIDNVTNSSRTMGTEMHGEYSDGVLNFFINFDMFVYKVEEKITMNSCDYDSNIKDG